MSDPSNDHIAAIQNPFLKPSNVVSEAQMKVLAESISSLDPLRLRVLLLAMTQESLEAKRIAARELVVTSQQVGPDEFSSDEDAEPRHSTKRKIGDIEEHIAYQAKYVWCENCGKEFDVTKNSLGDCVWHEGEKEPEEEFWEEHEEMFGSISDFEDDMPEGFRWSCCNGVGDSKGCQKTLHRPRSDARAAAKRARKG